MFRTVSRELAIVGVAYLTFALSKNLIDPSPVLKAVSNGWGVIRLESALALNHESFVQQIIARLSLGLLIALTYFYAVGMWLGLAGTAVVLFIKTRVAYVQLRRTFMLTMILGAVVFAVYPLAPPRFMPGLGMTDTVTLLGLDPAAPNSNSAISYNQFAAMPSLHYAWALLVMVAAFRFGGAPGNHRRIQFPIADVRGDYCNRQPLHSRRVGWRSSSRDSDVYREAVGAV